jgi:transcriptional regulator with XRE-family HTH domain
MKSGKTFLGPRLRQLRTQRKLTQADMARALGLSTSYVNLLENNQRSVSVQVLMRISEVYGVDWRDLVTDDSANKLADLRNVLQDPVLPSRGLTCKRCAPRSIIARRWFKVSSTSMTATGCLPSAS